MACGSCGGGRVVSATAGGRQVVEPRTPTKYVWKWTSSDRSEDKNFDTEQEARAWIKTGHSGALMVVPSSS